MGVLEEIAGSVLLAVESVPAGKVTTYGQIAQIVGRGGPRSVARILASGGDAVCWWRVVRSDGRIAAPLVGEASRLLAGEGVEVRNGRIDMKRFGTSV